MRYWIYGLTMCIALSACNTGSGDLSPENPKIKEALEKRRQDYIADVIYTCQIDMYQRAAEYVDSLIAAEIYFQISDSIVFPPKPEYPGWPGPIILNDTLRARPIFEEEKIVEELD